MYFVTVNRKPYILFAKTPSENAAIGLTEKQSVQLLQRRGGDWHVMAEWSASEFSHTDFMLAMHHREEPADPAQLLEVLPADLRSKAKLN
jgi:hypothetical protein